MPTPTNPSPFTNETDPADGMPSRASLAREVLGYRMVQLCEAFYDAKWVDDLEFDVWEMAHEKPYRFAGELVTDGTAQYFRDLATLGGAWWVWPDTAGKEGDLEILIPLSEWKAILEKRRKR